MLKFGGREIFSLFKSGVRKRENGNFSRAEGRKVENKLKPELKSFFLSES